MFVSVCSANDSSWVKINIKITIFVVFALISVRSGSLRKRKSNQFCVQEFCVDRQFHELTGQGGKLDVHRIVGCHI